MNIVIAAGVTLVIILGSIILLVVPGIMLSVRTKQRMASSAAPTPSAPPAGGATTPAPAKKDEEKKFKFVAFSWVSPYVYVATVLLAPSFIPDTLSAGDTVLLTAAAAIALSAVASTLVENFFGKTLEKKAYTVTMVALIAWLGLLLFQNNFSVTSTIKDAWKPAGEALEPLYRVLVGGKSKRASSEAPAPADTLNIDAYLDNIPGRFPAMTIAAGSRLGPVNDYDDSCLKHAQGGGSGTLVVMTRPDFTSEPVMATSDANGVTVPGHDGPAYQYFYVARGGNVLLNLQRREGDSSCR